MFTLLQLIIPGILLALESAPNITDREVVEKLVKLETGQQALNQRISDLRSEMKTGQEALNKRLDDSNNFMLAIIGLIIALFGYIL